MAKKQTTVVGSAQDISCELRLGDCIDGMGNLALESVNLAICDPPYNIGREYDGVDDNREAAEYLSWTSRWLSTAISTLHPHGSLWVFSSREFVSEIDVMAKTLGMHPRGHVVWAFTFGVNCPKNFTRAHTHLLYYTKARTKFTFNENAPGLRVPSARQVVYKDKRGNPDGRLPDDVWILRPREIEECFNGQSDIWLQSRVCGTYKEKIKGCDNQLPRPVVDRIVLACSNPGDLVLDPFLGSGTTAESAYVHGRNFVGFEQSKTYLQKAQERLANLPPRSHGS